MDNKEYCNQTELQLLESTSFKKKPYSAPTLSLLRPLNPMGKSLFNTNEADVYGPTPMPS